MTVMESKYELVLAGLKGFSGIKDPKTDETGWIAFKLNTTRMRASRLIREAREWEEKKVKKNG